MGIQKNVYFSSNNLQITNVLDKKNANRCIKHLMNFKKSMRGAIKS